MTGLIKGVIVGVCSLIPVGTLFFMLSSNHTEGRSVEEVSLAVGGELMQEDIAKAEELSPVQIENAEVRDLNFLVDEITPVIAISQRDTLGSLLLYDAMDTTGLTREQINFSMYKKEAVEGYLFEYDQDGLIRVLMPPDTSVYPNIEGAEVLTGLPRELIILSITEQKTVEGTKFEYEK